MPDKTMITLLGTVHPDPSGPQRLARALKALQPHCICVEMHAGQEHPKVAPAISEWLKQQGAQMQYEVTGSKKYCGEAAIPLLYADIKIELAEAAEIVEEGFEQMKQMIEMMGMPFQAVMDMSYNMQRETWQQVLEQTPASARALQVLHPDREKFMAKTIREACEKYDNVVMVCGILHRWTLAEALADLHPQVKTLLEYAEEGVAP